MRGPCRIAALDSCFPFGPIIRYGCHLSERLDPGKQEVDTGEELLPVVMVGQPRGDRPHEGVGVGSSCLHRAEIPVSAVLRSMPPSAMPATRTYWLARPRMKLMIAVATLNCACSGTLSACTRPPTALRIRSASCCPGSRTSCPRPTSGCQWHRTPRAAPVCRPIDRAATGRRARRLRTECQRCPRCGVPRLRTARRQKAERTHARRERRAPRLRW